MPPQLTVLFIAAFCILNIIIAAVFGGLFQRSYLKTKNKPMKYFSWFFIFLAVFLLVNTLPHILGVFEALGLPLLSYFSSYLDSIAIWSFIVSYIFLYLALSYFAMFVFSMGLARFKSYAFFLVALMGLVVAVLNILKPKNLAVDPFTKATILQASPSVMNLMIASLAVIWIVAIAICISRARRIAAKGLTLCSILLIAGLLLILTRLLSHVFIRGVGTHIMSDVAFFVGLILIAAIFYLRRAELREEQVEKIE